MIEEENIRLDFGRALQRRRHAEVNVIHSILQIQLLQLIRGKNQTLFHLSFRRLFLFDFLRELSHFIVFLFTVVAKRKIDKCVRLFISRRFLRMFSKNSISVHRWNNFGFDDQRQRFRCC